MHEVPTIDSLLHHFHYFPLLRFGIQLRLKERKANTAVEDFLKPGLGITNGNYLMNRRLIQFTTER